MPFAIVTGASRGIGKALARRLAIDSGYTVACIARSKWPLDELAAEHPNLLAVPLDLTDEAQIDTVVDALLAEHGPCALLVNNAGLGLRSAIEDLPLDRFRRLMTLNVFSCVQLIQKVLPGMRSRKAGTIVNISSLSGIISSPLNGGYCASKFALEALSDALRVEVKPFGVQVILIEPGPVRTNFATAAATESEGVLGDAESAYSEMYAAYVSRIDDDLKRAWTAEEVVDATVKAIVKRDPPHRVAAYDSGYAMGVLLRKVSPRTLDRMLAKRIASD